MTAPRSIRSVRVALSCLAVLAGAATPSFGQAPTTPTNINLSGGAAGASQRLPAGQATFGLRVPLRPNAENIITVTASDDNGQKVSKDVSITQLSLNEIVKAQVTAQRLTTPEIKALVADGTIDIKDPDNFNVSIFIIVLTIGPRPVRLQVPVVTPKEEPFGVGPSISIGCSGAGKGVQTTERSISIPCGGGGGGGSPTIQIIPFEIEVPDSQIEARVPGVIIIEGRIKTLKEFYKVNLLLMNVSGLFNLTDIMARLEVPEGALSFTAPKSGTVSIADIGPGGEGNGEFIVRGDKIGTHTVTAHFGAKLTAPFLPEPVPISGSASTDLVVKGPPAMDVTVQHPSYITSGVPYDLTVTIRNTDEELDALYASLELDVGIDAELIDEVTGLPMKGPQLKDLGDILKGSSVSRTFKVLPKKTGPIASCTAAADQNLKLSVVFTQGGPKCAIGTLPSRMESIDGRPTVTVVPSHNTSGVTVDPAIAALFSAPMIVQTITSGFDGGTFRLIDPAGNVLPGQLQFGDSFGGTVAVFRPSASLAYSTEYTIVVDEGIFDEEGRQLSSGLIARFTTESQPTAADTTPPTATLLIEPPVNPSAITKGQLAPVVVDSHDDIAVTRVDLLLDGELIDTKKPHSPVTFQVDTAGLAQGTTHQLKAVVFDEAGNSGAAALTLHIAPDSTPPTASIAAAASIARGRPLSVLVAAADDSRVNKVQLYIDSAADPIETLLVAPFLFTVQTTGLSAGSHLIRAIALDPEGNQGLAQHPLDVSDDSTKPTVVISNPVNGLGVRAGDLVSVLVTAVDNIGVASVETFLDAETTPRATSTAGFNLVTAGLGLGNHTLRAVARDLAGNTTTALATFNLFVPPADTTPPGAPDGSKIQVALPASGVSAIVAVAGAIEAGARAEITNATTLATAPVPPTATGAFNTQIEAAGGQTLSIVAIDAAGNRSAATSKIVPAPATLTSIQVTPATLTLNKVTPTRQLSVTGVYSDGSKSALTTGLTFESLDRAKADVTSAGLVAAGRNGSTTIRVSIEGVSPADVPVTVAMPFITNVLVTPSPVTLRNIGRTQQLSLTARSSDSTALPFNGSASFGTNDPHVATVNSSGLITAIGAGQTAITVAVADLTVVNVTVKVEIKTLTSISVNPSNKTFTGPGQTQALVVTGHYSDGASETLTGGITFQSTNTAVVSLSGNEATSGSNGTANIQVSVAGVTPVTVAVVVKSLVGLAFSPASLNIVGLQQARQLTVIGTYSDGSTANDPPGVTFQTTAANVATVSASGLVTSKAVGSSDISAHLGSLTPAVCPVTVVVAKPVSLVITPDEYTFTKAGDTVALDVRVLFDDKSTSPPVGPRTFTSRNPLVVTVDGNGTVTAVAEGTTIVDVTADGLAATVDVTVDIAPLVPPPVIDSLDRPRASTGDRFTIRGRNFGDTADENLVFLSGVEIDVLAARHDELVARVPRDGVSGAVQVIVGGQTSNAVGLTIYARRAIGMQVTSGVPSGPGPLVLNVQGIDVHSGDRVLLSSAPDMLAPLAFSGSLTAAVDGGGAVSIAPSAQAPDISNEFDDGVHSLELRVSGANVSAGPIYVMVGPDATGVIAGAHSALSMNHSLPTQVTFTNLTDLGNVPLPNGTVVAVSTLGSCTHRDRGGNCLDSVGGSIINGAESPSFPGNPRVRNLVVMNQRIDVVYDPLGTELAVSQAGTARVMVIRTNANGTVNGSTALSHAPITLTYLDTVHAPRSQSAIIADGLQKLVTVDLQDFRDSLGSAVPNVTFVASTLGSCTHRDRGGNCLSSAGGEIVGGGIVPEFGDVAHSRSFTIAGDHAEVQYRPGSVVTAVGTVATALVELLPARPNGSRIGHSTFSETPITLTSAMAEQAQVTVTPASVLADNADNRVIIVVSGIVGADGNPVPNGTKVVVSTLGSCTHRDKQGNCISSAGGVIKNGTASPDFGDVGHTRVLEVINGQIEAIYSAEGVALNTPAKATARIAFIPGQSPNGNRIGTSAFAIADVTLAAYGSATGAANPQSVIADGTPKTVSIVVSNIRDEAGNLVPDGAVVVASTLGSCTHRDRNGNCISSIGGSILNGAPSPEYGDVGHTRYFVVSGGQISVQYDPAPVLIGVPDTQVARIQFLPGRPSPSNVRGSRININAFHIVEVALTSPAANQANVTVVPTSIVGNAHDNLVAVTVSNITDREGRPAINGTKVVVSVLGSCTHRDAAGSCISSDGGTLQSGTASPEYGDVGHTRVHTVTNGTIEVVYNSKPLGYAANDSGIARLAFLPATPAGARIGTHAFAVASVSVVSMGSATITGPGNVAPNGQAVYTVSGVRDLNGAAIANGTKVVVSLLGSCTHRDFGGSCISSAGGAIVDGDASPEFGNVSHTRVFTVMNGGFTFTYQAPGSGTSVLQLLPATPSGSRIGGRTFALKSVSNTP